MATTVNDAVRASGIATLVKNAINNNTNSLKDTIAGLGSSVARMRTKVGGWYNSDQISSTGNYTPTSGELRVHAIRIYETMTIDALGTWCSTASAGGTITVTAGLWSPLSDGTGPDFTKLLASATIDTSTTGAKIATISAPVTLHPGLYFAGVLYVETAAPTTKPTISCSTATSGMWSTVPGGPPKSIGLKTLTTLPTDNTGSLTSLGDAPVVSLRRSA